MSSVGLTILVGLVLCSSALLAQDTSDVQTPDTVQLKDVRVDGRRTSGLLISRMDDIHSGAIYAAKKTELIMIDQKSFNTSTNNARQAFSGVAGLNIWESDGAGLQLGIGGRGLSPERTSNFTTRQNGYDISADPLGYPESYYTPPLDAISRIEIVRGGGALRYGTQFGGVINFVFARPPLDSPLQLSANVTGGSFGFAGLFVRAQGTVSNTSYSVLYQGKRADGWRPNSAFDMHTAYAAVSHRFTSTTFLSADYTYMRYLSQQPGGLTDKQFATDPSVSVRARNWFQVNWSLASIRFDHIIGTSTSIRSTLFGTMSGRSALGNLDRINMVDLGGPRTLIDATFTNIGNETTLTHDLQVLGLPATIVGGFRLFHGTTTQQQGNASDGFGPDFSFTNSNNLEGSDYRFPNDNVAVFAEGLFNLGGGFSLVPGVRVEHIVTRAEGHYRVIVRDLAGNPVVDTTIVENNTRSRSIALGGLGLSWKSGSGLELFANAVQNYRSITFSDLRISNPNLVVDTAIGDERGYTLDLGIRGSIGSEVSLNASVFYVRYNDRIGEVLRDDVPPLFLPFRYRTNVADAYTTGIEAVAEVDVSQLLLFSETSPRLLFTINGSIIEGRYVNSANTSINNNDVELVPPYIVRAGLRSAWKGLTVSYIMAWVGQQYSDATNAEFSASAVTGIIPSYMVTDLTVSYDWTWGGISLTGNNLFNASYFTRRATSYPGPGIIPAEPLSIFASFRINGDVITD